MAEAKNILSAMHISSNLGLYEAARTSFFTFHINEVSASKPVDGQNAQSFGEKLLEALNTLKVDHLGDTPLTVANIIDNLELNVIKAPVPHFSLEVQQYRRGNEQVKFAGVPTFDAGSITVDDVVGLDTKSILQAWQALAYDVDTRTGGRMKNYKANCTLCEYTQDFELVRSWTLYGCWVSKLDEGEFDRENDGKRQITAEIQYDRAEMKVETREKAE